MPASEGCHPDAHAGSGLLQLPSLGQHRPRDLRPSSPGMERGAEEATAVLGPVCNPREPGGGVKSLSRAGNDGPRLAGVLGPRHTQVAPVLFQLQVRHVPEKLRVIIRRCDRQSARKGLRQIRPAFPCPDPVAHFPGRPPPSPAPSSAALASFGALGSTLCGRPAQRWDAIPTPTDRPGDACCVPSTGVLRAQRRVWLAQDGCRRAKVGWSDGSPSFFVTPGAARRPASAAAPHGRPGKCLAYPCGRKPGLGSRDRRSGTLAHGVALGWASGSPGGAPG